MLPGSRYLLLLDESNVGGGDSVHGCRWVCSRQGRGGFSPGASYPQVLFRSVHGRHHPLHQPPLSLASSFCVLEKVFASSQFWILSGCLPSLPLFSSFIKRQCGAFPIGPRSKQGDAKPPRFIGWARIKRKDIVTLSLE